jgi:integrase
MPRQSRGCYLDRRPGSDIWYIFWSDTFHNPATGRKESRSRRRSTGTADRKEAEKVLAGFILERDAEGKVDGADALITFILDDYYEEHVSKKPSREVAALALVHLKAHAGSSPIGHIDRDWCDAYANKRREGRIGRGARDGTIRRELGVLVAALNHAAKKKKIKKADIPYVWLPEEPAGKDVWLTHEEADKLRAECKTFETRLFIEIALATWARKRAIETLTIFQVDLERMRINFNPPGRKQTKKRRPIVPISDDLKPWITEAVKRAKERKSEWLFGDPGSRRKGFEASVRRAGISGKRVTPHVLRHTGATWAAQAGVPLWEIAGVLGDTLRTTERRYAHHHPDYLKGAVNFRREATANDRGDTGASVRPEG